MRKVYQESVSTGNMKRNIRELKNKMYAYSEMEQMVRECTCNDAQTPSEMLMKEIVTGRHSNLAPTHRSADRLIPCSHRPRSSGQGHVHGGVFFDHDDRVEANQGQDERAPRLQVPGAA